ncbi:DNA helicase, partial [Streptomyces sp. NWU49]|uniref:3'-5' exonuclease n=1 Tax=Streptomyces sp. NWU49 TaxID=2201153 RepID=UPI000D67FA37
DYTAYDPAGRDLQPFVDLVDTHGPDAILDAVSQLAEETHADVTVSTAHKAKGREWPAVRIGKDFPQPKDTDPGAPAASQPPEVSDLDARLAYVAVTRARNRLDLGGLAWTASAQQVEGE